MIVLEQHIAISIYHQQSLQHFDVIEVLTDDGTLTFKVMKDAEYFFTLIGESEDGTFRLVLSEMENLLDFTIDSEVLSKLTIALYSVFLNEKAS